MEPQKVKPLLSAIEIHQARLRRMQPRTEIRQDRPNCRLTLLCLPIPAAQDDKIIDGGAYNCAERNWRKLRGFADLAKVTEGVPFINEEDTRQPNRVAA